MMKIRARSFLGQCIKIFVIVVLMGVLSEAKPTLARSINGNSDMDDHEPPRALGRRSNNRKGMMGGMGKRGMMGMSKSLSPSPDCVPLYPTPAPTSKGKHHRRKNRRSARGKGSKGSSSEAPTGSTAPTVFCSDVPSAAPTLSANPTLSVAPSSGSKGKGGKGGKEGKGGKSSFLV